MNKTIAIRVGAIGAALAVGGGAGAAIYAASSGGTSTAQPATTTVVTAQPASATRTVSTLTQLYKNVTPGVVDITVTSSSSDGFGFGGQQQTQAEGSGIVYDAKGHILTNAHVVDGAKSITVRFQSGKTAKATLVGIDAGTDIAVIKVDVDASLLHPLTLGSSASVQPGEEVIAIGSPFGLPGTMTSGIVSAVDRTIQAPNNFSISGAIQTDAPINHGNSGGPLLDASGDVIGVNAQIESDSGGNDGVGFAIPSNTVKSIVSQLLASGKAEHAYLGVSLDSNAAKATVGQVRSGTPAASAGLKAGDVITAIDGKQVASAPELQSAIDAKRPGDTVSITYTRGGQSHTVQVKLATRPNS